MKASVRPSDLHRIAEKGVCFDIFREGLGGACIARFGMKDRAVMCQVFVGACLTICDRVGEGVESWVSVCEVHVFSCVDLTS